MERHAPRVWCHVDLLTTPSNKKSTDVIKEGLTEDKQVGTDPIKEGTVQGDSRDIELDSVPSKIPADASLSSDSDDEDARLQ